MIVPVWCTECRRLVDRVIGILPDRLTDEFGRRISPPLARQPKDDDPKKAARRRHQLLRSKFTAAQWTAAAEQASADRRRQTGNRRYTPPRAPR